MKRRVSLGDFLRRWLHGATDYEPFRDLHGLLRRLLCLLEAAQTGLGLRPSDSHAVRCRQRACGL